MTPKEEYEQYIMSGAYKRELKIIIICTIILVIITLIVAIITYPHYTPEKIECIKQNPWSRYLCGA